MQSSAISLTNNQHNHIRKRERGIELDSNDGQLVKQKQARTMPEVAGKILCIELENFMCHSSLKLVFDPYEYNCAYIVGPNGSGKSALFASLNIGLGGSGRSNERGKSIKDYIQEGKEYANVRIYITNEGSNAIPDYNKIIIIERRITQTASSIVLKMTSHIGGREEIKSKKTSRIDLDLILQQFNIDLDNPLSWLSQDRARQFLQSMKPERLYELYRKSSEMDSTETVYRTLDVLYEELSKIMESMDREKKAKEEKYLQKKARFDAINMIKEKIIEKQNLAWYRIWTPVRDCQNEIIHTREKLENAIKNLDEKNPLKTKHENSLEQINIKQQHWEQERDKAASKSREQNDRMNEMKRDIRQLTFDLNDADIANKTKERKLRSLENESVHARKKLQELIGNSERDIETERRQFQEEQKEITNQMQSIVEQKQAVINELRGFETDYQNQKRLHDVEYAQYTGLNKQKEHIQQQKNQYEQTRQNKLAIFGQNIPRILELINNNKNLFSKLPIGPIGNCIKLIDQKWADPVEYLLNRYLGVFLCDSAADRKMLDALCTDNQIRKPQIITTRFSEQKFDTSGKEPPNGYTTVARVLDIKEATVFNYIMDKARVECVILFEQDDVARNEMYPNPPVNALKALTLKCTEVNPPRGQRPYQLFRNEYRSHVFSNSYLSNDMRNFDANSRQIDQELSQRTVQLQNLKDQLQKLARNTNALRHKRDEFDVQMTRINQRRYTIDEELQKLDDIMLNGDRIANLKSSIEQTEEDKRKCSRELNELHRRHDEILEKTNERKGKLELAQQIAARLKNDFNQKQNEIESCAMQIRKVEDSLQNIRQSLERFTVLKDRYTAELEQKQTECQKKESDAQSKQQDLLNKDAFRGVEGIQNGNGRPDFDQILETPELERKLRALENEIKIEQECQEERPTIETLREYENDYKRFNKEIRSWQARCNSLKRMIDSNKKRLHLLKTALPHKLEHWFQDCMSIRNYKGTLEVNDNTGVINIKVETHKIADEDDVERLPLARHRVRRNTCNEDIIERGNTREKRIVQDLKGLSGGERSYTTACFIMALWKCMESPFRCMDEFDVFMDMVNRRIIMEILADMAKDNREVQFFFFTPQPIQELKRDGFQVFTLKRIAGIFNDSADENRNENMDE